jgi:FlaA1/EpsC-like NDP-sugar epimerase
MNLLFFVSHWVVQKTFNSLSGKLLKLRNRHLFCLDIVIFSLTPLLALILRLDGNLGIQDYLSDLSIITALFILIKISVFWSLGFYRRYWRYASIEELIYVIVLTASAVVVQAIVFDVLDSTVPLAVDELPHSLPFIDGLLSCVFIGGLRFSFRVTERIKQRRLVFNPQEPVLIIGAGSAGISLVQDMQRSPQLGLRPVAFIDDDPQKLNFRIRGIPVVGGCDRIPEIVKIMGIRRVIIAMPTVAGQVIREIVDICQATGIQTSTLPGIHEILNGRVRVESIRDVRIEDLLRRDPLVVNSLVKSSNVNHQK